MYLYLKQKDLNLIYVHMELIYTLLILMYYRGLEVDLFMDLNIMLAENN